MNIIIPLGGKGERFKNEGYLLPKALIKIFDKEIIFYVLDNLSLNEDDNIFIIYNNELSDYNFEEIILNKYPNMNLIKLNKQTKGATETLFVGINEIINNFKHNKKCLIIDGDTFYTENIVEIYRNIDCNAVFYVKNYDQNPIFSYIELNENNEIINIKEKIKISDNANTGAYAFSDINELLNYSEYIINNNITFNNEPYTSCVIAEMLKNNKKFIGYELNNDYVHILGTPKQVNNFINIRNIFLFDLDGTLVLTDDIYYEIWYEILNKYNIYLTKEIFENYIQGNSDTNVIKSLMPNLDIDINSISNMKDMLFNKNLDKIKIIDGAINFIKKIKMYGHKIAIVTNCNRITAENIIIYMKIDKLIDGIIIGGECIKTKPFPDPYIKACKLFNISTKSAFVFEDSKTGILSGRNINPKCLIGIKTLYDEITLKNLGVNIFINDYTDDDLYQKIVNYELDINNKIKEYIFNSYRKDIKDIIIFNEKIKGGYISDVIKIIIKLDDNTEQDCILKLENKNETKLSIMANNLGLYEREYYFYDNISKYVNIEIPKFYSIIKDNDFNSIGILMENINKENFKLNLNLNIESIDISLKIIDSIAKLHSKFWGKNLQNTFKNLLKNNDDKFNPVWANYVNNNWDSFKNKWCKLLNKKQLLISEKIIKNFQKIQNDLSDNNLTLCHGDVKSPNIFYKQIEDNKYIPYFIDWQYISYGKGIQDIVFLMIESYDIDKMNIYCHIFKNYYYSKLIEYNVENYSVNEYEKDFINSICYYPFFVSIWFGTTPEEDLIDKNFPFFFIQKLFNFIEKYVPIDFYD
jgi:beta-phosphoglucomutase-like phosphatase (HAD superfamily)/molybdopterin-guanine dinucleotide biosynthesis protein A